jgi:GTPase SAR1 family protein
MIILTPEQQEISDKAVQILKSSKRLLIKGSAGTGKTTLVNQLIETLVNENVISKHSIVCAAPTHKALAILSSKITKNYVTYQTIASVLSYRHSYCKKTGNSLFKPQINPKYPPLQNTKTLIIDEGSMLSLEQIVFLEKYGNSTKIIFIGDHRQLNPVGEEESTVFLGKPSFFNTQDQAGHFTFSKLISTEAIIGIYVPEYEKQHVGFEPYPEVELIQIVRQGPGNPVINLSRNISAIYDYKERLIEGKGFVYGTNYDKIVEELAIINGSDDLKYLAWTNEDVDKVNSDVRNKIYVNPKRVELGESIIFDSPYGDQYMTNQELKIETLDIAEIVFTTPVVNTKGHDFKTQDITLKCYILNGKQIDEWGTGELVWKGVFIIHEDSDKQFKYFGHHLFTHCKRGLLEQASRRQFLAKFADFKYNHALTIHKSQGSSFRRVILNVGNMAKNPTASEKQRLFYTGITRTMDLLILYNVT